MNHKLVLPIAALFLIVLLTACGGGNQSAYCDPNNLLPPVLTHPNDGGQYIINQTIMTWYHQDQTCEPEGYNIEVDTVSDFSGNVYGGTGTMPNSAGWPLPVIEGETYYWRVQATVGSANGPWSSVQTFHGVLPCEQSALVAPVPLGPWEARTLFFDDPYYSWDYQDPACAPEGYHIQVSSDQTFASTDVDHLIHDPVLGWKPTTTLSDCTVYYWRIAGTEGGVDGPFSDPVSFYVSVDGLCPTPECPPTGLIAPEAIGPKAMGQGGFYEIVSSLTPTFEWDYPTYCDPPGFVIRLEPEFDLSGSPLQGGFGLTDSWTPVVPLETATQYWWDVAAISPPALGPSDKNTFFTGPECSFGDTLGPPELISPSNGTQIHEPYAWLHFTAGTSVGCIPDGYTVDLQTDPNFMGPSLLQTFSFPATNVITEELDDCTEYFWRVAAIQDSIGSPWSQTGSFFTNVAGNCAISMIPEIPYAMAIRDLACYLGPDPGSYPIEGYLLEGESSPIVAQNMAGTWWVVHNPDGIPEDRCYIPKVDTEALGDLVAIPMWNNPDIPRADSGSGESGAVVCSAYDNKDQCLAAGCYWYSKSLEVLSDACYSDPL
jgi:hypothetical protein